MSAARFDGEITSTSQVGWTRDPAAAVAVGRRVLPEVCEVGPIDARRILVEDESSFAYDDATVFELYELDDVCSCGGRVLSARMGRR